MALTRIDGVEKPKLEVKVEKKVEIRIESKPLLKENGTEKLNNLRSQGDLTRFRLNAQFQANNPAPPPTPDERIASLKKILPHLPPEDRQAVQNTIKGLELTRDAADPTKVREMAEKIVNDNGGVDHFDSVEAGKDLAEMARLSPSAGKAVLDEMLKIVKSEDRDEIAQDFVENMSEKELSELARTPEGKAMLETAKHELEQGKVHDDERATLDRIDVALQTSTQTQDEAVAAAAERVKDSMQYDVVAGGEELAEEIARLNSLYGEQAGGALMAQLYKDMPHELGASLRLMDDLSETQKNDVGRALGDMFGGLSADEKAGFAEWVSNWTVQDAFTPNFGMENKATSFADLISRSFNTEMKTAVVNAMMEQAKTIEPGLFGDNGGVDVQALFTSAANIANSLPSAERAEMLQKIIETLPEVNLPSLIKDPETKDALSRLFMNSGEQLLHNAAPDGAFASRKFQEGMIKFMELTLFSEHPGELRPQMMEEMVRLTANVGDAAAQPPVSQAEYENAHGGWSQQDHVEAMSGLMAMAWKAAENQKGAIQADQKQREETMKMFTGLAFSFVPGAGKVLGELGGEGAEFLDRIAGKVRDFAWDKAKGALQSGVENRLNDLMSGDSLENIDKMLGTLRDTVLSLNASLPNGENGELDLRSKFQSAFAFYQLIQF